MPSLTVNIHIQLLTANAAASICFFSGSLRTASHPAIWGGFKLGSSQ